MTNRAKQVWNPSGRIDHAYMVLRRFENWTLGKLGTNYIICRIITEIGTESTESKWTKGEADTASMAICLAALGAVKESPHE